MSLEQTLTVHRLGLFEKLGKSLKTTNWIESGNVRWTYLYSILLARMSWSASKRASSSPSRMTRFRWTN